MSVLFKPYRVGELEIRNRFMRSATTSAYADEHGVVGSEIIRLYENLAKGGVGLIVKGHLYVDPLGKAHQGMAGIHSDDVVPRLRELTDAVHRHGGAIFAQINHGGLNASAGERMGLSAYEGRGGKAREMTSSEVWAAVESFGEAAERAVRAGFDGVQIHAAHGYLISSSLSREGNRRLDEWGGTPAKRMRMLMEVVDEIRGRVGHEVPLAVKMNCDDFHPTGFTVEDACAVAVALAARGIDLIEVSGGGVGEAPQLQDRARSGDPAWKELAFAGHCEKIRAATKPKPLALVKGFRSMATMQAAVDRGLCDVVSMSRPFIREPDLARKLERGQREAECIRCDACRSLFGKETLRCLLE